MRKSLFIVLAFSSMAMAGGPKYSYDNPRLNDEFENAYKDIKNVSNSLRRGTTTNDDALAGNIGEYVESVIGDTNFGAADAFTDATAISLTAGDWDVTFIADAAMGNAGSFTNWKIAISTTSGNTYANLVAGSNLIDGPAPTASAQVTLVIPSYRISLSTTKTIYGKFLGHFTSIQALLDGARLSARRVR